MTHAIDMKPSRSAGSALFAANDPLSDEDRKLAESFAGELDDLYVRDSAKFRKYAELERQQAMNMGRDHG